MIQDAMSWLAVWVCFLVADPANGQFVGTQKESQQAKGGKHRPDPGEIEKLINQLGDKNFTVREAASKTLERFGLDALEALRKTASTATDAEVRKRALAAAVWGTVWGTT